jgi:hypothetical protein
MVVAAEPPCKPSSPWSPLPCTMNCTGCCVQDAFIRVQPRADWACSILLTQAGGLAGPTTDLSTCVLQIIYAGRRPQSIVDRREQCQQLLAGHPLPHLRRGVDIGPVLAKGLVLLQRTITACPTRKHRLKRENMAPSSWWTCVCIQQAGLSRLKRWSWHGVTSRLPRQGKCAWSWGWAGHTCPCRRPPPPGPRRRHIKCAHAHSCRNKAKLLDNLTGRVGPGFTAIMGEQGVAAGASHGGDAGNPSSTRLTCTLCMLQGPAAQVKARCSMCLPVAWTRGRPWRAKCASTARRTSWRTSSAL